MALDGNTFLNRVADKVLDSFIGDLPPVEEIFHCDFSNEPSQRGRKIGIRRPAVPDSHRVGFDGEEINPLLPEAHNSYEYEEAFNVTMGEITNGSGHTPPLSNSIVPNFELWMPSLDIDHFGGIDKFVADITPTVYQAIHEHIYRAYTQDVAHGEGELKPLILATSGNTDRYNIDAFTFRVYAELAELMYSLFDKPAAYGANDFGSYQNAWSNIMDYNFLLHPWLFFGLFHTASYDDFFNHNPDKRRSVVTTPWGSRVWCLNAWNGGSYGQQYTYEDTDYSKLGILCHKSAVTLVGRSYNEPDFPGRVENRVLPNGMPIQFRLHYNMDKRRHQFVVTSLLGMHISDKAHNHSRAILVDDLN